MFSRRSGLYAAAALVGLGALSPGCTRRTTAPLPQTRVQRTVTVTLLDSLGAPVGDQQVSTLALVDSAGLTVTAFGRTDANGRAAFVLGDGPWAVSVEPVTVAAPPAPRLVAGCTFVVAGASRPASDTVLVRLRLCTASRISGTTTAAGQTNHRGTIVSTNASMYTIATTDAAGDWTLEDLPPGTWNLTMFRAGNAPATRMFTLPAPGSSVTIPAVQLN